MSSRPSRTRKPLTPSKSKAAARPQGIRKSILSAPPRRSSRLLATQTACQPLQTAETTAEVSIVSTSRKRKHDTVSRDTPLWQTKKSRVDPIDHWRKEGDWPKELFEPDTMPTIADDGLLARTISRERSFGASSTSTRDLDRDEKAAPYQTPRCEELLQSHGLYMREDQNGPSKKTAQICAAYLEKEVELPQDTGFADHLFTQTFIDCHSKNEARIIRDLALLVCPSPENLFILGAITTQYLCESVDEAWKLSTPLTLPRPQPDFSVGFTREAFTEEQLEKVRIVLGNGRDQCSIFRATWCMYFPFLSCEAKKGDGALDVADRQNAHSMGIAVRAVVNLFKLANCAETLDGTILAFSISYTDTYVRIYGYYPRITEKDTKYYRHLIAAIALRNSQAQERWKPYRFVRNIYEHWAPPHLKRLQSILTKMDTIVAAPIERTGSSQKMSCSSVVSGVTSVEDLPTEPTTPTEMAVPQSNVPSSQRGRDGKSTTSKRRTQSRLAKSQTRG